MSQTRSVLSGLFIACIIHVGWCSILMGGEFRNCTEEVGLDGSNGEACWVDLDNDGWTDLVVGGKVWKNFDGKRFEEIASGVGNVVAADFNNDGFTDLFSWSSLRLLANDQSGGFIPLPMPELPRTTSLGACCGDWDGDGFVDVYVGGYENWGEGLTFPDLFLMNGSGRKLDIGRSDARYRARGVTACDFDLDGDLDVYVSNYRLQPNVLWQNDGRGVFEDRTAKTGSIGTSAGFGGGHSIGAAWGDFDNDGRFDLFVGNFAHRDSRGNQPQSRFLRNVSESGDVKFEDKGTCGVFYQESYASPAAADFDNDGDLDLFFTTVYGTASFGRPNNAVLFRNEGNFRFSDVTAASGLGGLPPTYQAAWADFDRDGDLDLISGGKLFRNEMAQGHWLELSLEADSPGVNRSAIGATVTLKREDASLIRQVEAGTGQGNQNSSSLHFGLGGSDQPADVTIRWPNGRVQTVQGLKIDQRHRIAMDSAGE